MELCAARSSRPSVVRDAEWSLVFWRTGMAPELYHRATDPGETKDIAKRHPREVQRLHEAYLHFLRENETPAKNYWPRRWLMSWGESKVWKGVTQRATSAP